MFKKWFGKPKEPSAEKPDEPVTSPPPPGEAPSPPEAAAPRAAAAKGESAQAAAPEEKPSKWSLFSRALAKTRSGLRSLFGLHRSLDEGLLGDIERELYAADFGPNMVEALLSGPEGVRAAWKERKIEDAEGVREFLKARLKEMLKKRDSSLCLSPAPPTVILVAGVNGTGKTTSVAKLSKMLRDQGGKVVLAAADTFRAAAVEQLTVWSRRLDVEIITGPPGADPASVAFRSAEAAVERNADFLIVDTAGRLHTQKNLMRELAKIRSVLSRKIPGSPHESLLVLDATTGQNAINQAKIFQEEIQVTGILLAKLDGTAKGGIVVTINNILDIPVKFIGVGEKLDDLEPFDVDRFVDALFEE